MLHACCCMAWELNFIVSLLGHVRTTFSDNIGSHTMEGVRTFLESSTIHGLVYIATTKKSLAKIFWTLVVIGGFTGAGIMIYNSFQSWNESPIKTTTETQPITEITFPKVTVCPPKNTYTDLNYDLVNSKNMTLDNETINELTKYAADMLYDHLKDEILSNINKLEDNDRYYNWYHGYTYIQIPDNVNNGMSTGATSGSVSTQYFGDKFDAYKMDRNISYIIIIYPPPSVQNNPNVTLHFVIEKQLLKDLSMGYDGFSEFDDEGKVSNVAYINSRRNYTPPGSHQSIWFRRAVILADVKKQNLELMPGLKLTWHYSGIDVEKVPKRWMLNTNHFARKEVQCIT